MFDARGRRHVRPDGLVFRQRAAYGRDLLILVLLFVRVVRAVLEVRVGYGLRMMVHRSSGGGRRVDVARGRQGSPKRFWRYVDRIVQRRALLRLRTEVRLGPAFLTADEKCGRVTQKKCQNRAGMRYPMSLVRTVTAPQLRRTIVSSPFNTEIAGPFCVREKHGIEKIGNITNVSKRKRNS